MRQNGPPNTHPPQNAHSQMSSNTIAAYPSTESLKERSWPPGAEPWVRVLCLSYNHADFMEQCLEGILAQKTAFPVHVVIHDDASRDGTQEILKRYAARFPDLITLVLQTENQFSRGLIAPIDFAALPPARYTALCEGDDFWSDENKLQIQVDFLERNPEFVISGHNCEVISLDGSRSGRMEVRPSKRRDFSAADVMRGKAHLPTCSRVFRNVINERPPEERRMLNTDRLWLCMLGRFGKSHFHHDIAPAAYRQHEGGVWSRLGRAERNLQHIEAALCLFRYFRRVGENSVAAYHWRRFVWKALVAHLLRSWAG